jgi:HlyD family secretion protein
VQSGQSVQITFDAVPDKTYTGTVSKVDYAGQNDSGVISYTVYIDILDGDSSLRPEMTANIDIESEKRTNVLLVPNNAVKPYQGGKAVQVPAERNDRGPRPSQPRYMPVKVGIVGTTHTEIIEGIDEGATIISGTAQTPREGGGGGILPVPGGAR